MAKKKAKIVKTKVPPDEKEDEKKESRRAKVKLSRVLPRDSVIRVIRVIRVNRVIRLTAVSTRAVCM